MTRSKSEAITSTLLKVPIGNVVSYGQIADLAGLPGRARLVGKVLRESDQNLPWYRVLRSTGQLAFKSGSKEALRQIDCLAEEGVEVIRNKVDLGRYQWQPSLADMMFLLDH